jgi:hypothetical protein
MSEFFKDPGNPVGEPYNRGMGVASSVYIRGIKHLACLFIEVQASPLFERYCNCHSQDYAALRCRRIWRTNRTSTRR